VAEHALKGTLPNHWSYQFFYMEHDGCTAITCAHTDLLKRNINGVNKHWLTSPATYKVLIATHISTMGTATPDYSLSQSIQGHKTCPSYHIKSLFGIKFMFVKVTEHSKTAGNAAFFVRKN
jgi:hypothetical protein